MHSLRTFNTFGIDVSAREIIHAKTMDDLRDTLLRVPADELFILGGGSNVLFTQDLDKTVLRVELAGMKILEENSDYVIAEFGAGEVWNNAVWIAVERGWGGIENLALIPGSVGASPVQNIGAYGVELKDVLVHVRYIDLQTREERTITNEECRFAYRDSIFKHELKNRVLITHVAMRFAKKPVLNTSYGALEKELAEIPKEKRTVRDVAYAVVQIRTSKLPDPAVLGNAGSFFKNPEVSAEKAREIADAELFAPIFPLPNGNAKIAAGWLIEQCGWKGKRVGNVGMHAEQALVLVNYGGSTGAELLAHAERVRASVQERFGITLDMEVNVV